MKVWCYYSPYHHHAWAYPEEPAMLPGSGKHFGELIGLWDTPNPFDTFELRCWISRQIRLLGYPKPPFLNITKNALEALCPSSR